MIGRFTLFTLALLLLLTLTVRQGRAPVSSCEHRLATFITAPVEMKGSIVEPEPPTPEEILITQDARLMP